MDSTGCFFCCGSLPYFIQKKQEISKNNRGIPGNIKGNVQSAQNRKEEIVKINNRNLLRLLPETERKQSRLQNIGE